MTSIRLIFCLCASLFIGSCTTTTNHRTNEPQTPPAIKPDMDKLVKASVTNSEGTTLAMTFDSEKQTATMILNGEVIRLKQERMASGVSYSNAHYQYHEHQGKIALQKDGKTIFTNEK